jgi:hypothetical protein
MVSARTSDFCPYRAASISAPPDDVLRRCGTGSVFPAEAARILRDSGKHKHSCRVEGAVSMLDRAV